MIKFRLRCDREHEFDTWFQSGSAYDAQHKRGLLACPQCGSSTVEKAVMAPSITTGISTGSATAATSDTPAGRDHEIRERDNNPPATSGAGPSELASGPFDPRFVEMVRRYTEHVRSTAENVGEKFAEEARKIHYEETEARGIYGKATDEEVGQLLEEGIEFMPLPQLPEDKN